MERQQRWTYISRPRSISRRPRLSVGGWSISGGIIFAMAGVCRPRHPERTVLHRVFSHHFDSFVAEYESRFEKEYGFLRPIIKEVVERYLDCGNPRCGFSRIRCPDCGEERVLMFSCRPRTGPARKFSWRPRPVLNIFHERIFSGRVSHDFPGMRCSEQRFQLSGTLSSFHSLITRFNPALTVFAGAIYTCFGLW